MRDTSVDQRLLKMERENKKLCNRLTQAVSSSLDSMKLLADSVPGIAANKVSTRIAEIQLISPRVLTSVQDIHHPA